MSRIKKSFLGILLGLWGWGPAMAATQPQLLMGSGNIGDGYTSAMVDCKINSLLNFNAPTTRLTTSSFFNGSTPSPQTLDWVIQKTSAAGIRGMLLFDYYLSQGPMGTYSQWYAIGAAYAARFRPNSAWMTANTANPALGITMYQAFNEPDNTAFGPQIPTTQYHDGLQGLADGIHSVDPTLKVFPGGYSRPNAQSDYTCGGYCTAITDLLNNGTLDGIDLHTYFGFWTPVSNWNTSSQHNFDAVKSVCGVTRDINVCVTESGYGVTGAEGGSTPTAISEATSAGYNLTVLWDGLGIVGNAGQSVSQITHSFTLVLEDPTSTQPDLAFTTSQCPWVPNPRGQMIQLVANLTQGMSFTSLLPKSRGEYILTGPGRNKKMWVWQDRTNWTNIGGTSYNVTGIPSGVVGLEVYGAAGLITGYPITVQTSYNVTGLPVANTYMFVAVGGSPTPTPSVTQSCTPTQSATATPSATATQTLSASATPTITETPSMTATQTETPVFSPTDTPTITLTPTPVLASPTATLIAGLQQGALKASPLPNPNPKAIRLLLGPGVDTVAMRCSSVGYSTVGVERQPVTATGWMDLRPSVLARLPNGVFYVELWGEKSGKMVGERVLCKVMVLR